VIHTRQLARQVDGVVEVVVEHQRAHSQPRRGVGHSLKRGQRSPAIDDVVPGGNDVESGILGSAGSRPRIARGRVLDLESEAELSHLGTVAHPIGVTAWRRPIA
jgi:hypothetical protein